LSGNCHLKTPKKGKIKSQRSQLLVKVSQLLLRILLTHAKNKCDGHHTYSFFEQKQHAFKHWCFYNVRDFTVGMLLQSNK